MHSYWQKEVLRERYDLVIIGAGFTGLNLAREFMLARGQARVVVIDPALGGLGASVRNAGFACFGSISELLSDMALMGEEKAISLLTQRQEGVYRIEQFCEGTDIYRPCAAHEYFLPQNRMIWEHSKDSLSRVNQLLEERGAVAAYTAGNSVIGSTIGAIAIKGEGQVHPARLHQKLLREVLQMGVEVIAQAVASIEQDDATVVLGNGISVRGEWLANCANGFSHTLDTRQEVQPARAQVLITSEIDDLPYDGNYHMDEGYFYFRNVGKRLLLGGGRHLDRETEHTDVQVLNPLIQENLETLLHGVLLPNKAFTIEHRWVGIMGMRPDKYPRAEMAGNYLNLSGMSGMGVALSFVLPTYVVKLIA